MPGALPAHEAPLTDFELVRNAEGQWLLILPRLPDALTDNPFEELRVRVEDQNLILENSTARALVSSLLSHHYLKALETDRPQTLLVSVIDDDGRHTFSRKVKLSFAG